MSGHSKWHNIQAKKGKADAARGKIFTKIGREIAIAVREGGSNPEVNGKLRLILCCFCFFLRHCRFDLRPSQGFLPHALSLDLCLITAIVTAVFDI